MDGRNFAGALNVLLIGKITSLAYFYGVTGCRYNTEIIKSTNLLSEILVFRFRYTCTALAADILKSERNR